MVDDVNGVFLWIRLVVELPAGGVVGCDQVPELESVLAKLFSRAGRSIPCFGKALIFSRRRSKRLGLKVLLEKLSFNSRCGAKVAMFFIFCQD